MADKKQTKVYLIPEAKLVIAILITILRLKPGSLLLKIKK